MFTMAKIRNGSTYLESHLGANDYYSKGERVAGVWMGLGAGKLGLRGEVTPAQFESLRVNEHPSTGEHLTPRTRENRVAFFDFQCSAQKSVSIMAVLMGDERLREAHKQASVYAMGKLEKFASCQRNTATTRRNEITGNLCAAAFTHDASRALDPQLHTHFVVANATDANGEWLALNESVMLEAIRYAGKVYQNVMAREVQNLGYKIRHVREDGKVTGFEIEGIWTELCERFSKRRKEIEAGIIEFRKTEHREPSRAEISAITRQTRSAELREITTQSVRELQFGQLDAVEWAQLQSVYREARERGHVTTVGNDLEKAALKHAVHELFERRSVLREHDILAEALNQNLGALNLDKLAGMTQAEKGGLVRLAEHEGEPLRSDYATREGLARELWSVNFVQRTNGTCPAFNRDFKVAERLLPEQREAVQSILQNQDQLQSFRGVAGSGKTTTLLEIQRGMNEAGHRVLAIAPTASAAQTLREEGFNGATTVADFLQNGSSTLNLRGAVILCDEAGLQSNRQGEALLRLAQKHDMRVIFVGDIRQHVSVEAGDFLRVLENHSPLSHCEVGEILRQQTQEYREAVAMMAGSAKEKTVGSARKGMAALDELGWVHEGKSGYLRAAAGDYFKLTDDGKNLTRCLAICPTWEENYLLTKDIRDGLKERGLLSGTEEKSLVVNRSLQWTTAQKVDRLNYEIGHVVTFAKASEGWKAGESATVTKTTEQGVFLSSAKREAFLPLSRPGCFDVGTSHALEICRGDKIQILGNRKNLGLINGQILTVAKLGEDGSILSREGPTIPGDFRQWTHGYVVTSHKAQGRTCEHVLVAAAELNARAAYVACSRGKWSCTVHTPDKTHLLEKLPEGSREAALDVLAAKEKVHSPIQDRPTAWKKAEYLSRKIRARIARADEMRHVVRRWHGERHLSNYLQKKMQNLNGVPLRSLNREAVQSIQRKTNNQGIER
jgi:conjugative relaxase-like TrwC/TraI family protein